MLGLRIPLRLRGKLAMAFGLVLLPVLGLLIYDYLDDYRMHEEAVLDGQLRTAEAVGAMLEATFDQGVAVGQAMAIDPVIRTLDPARVDPHLASFAPVYPGYQSLNVWDANGQNVGASVPLPPDQQRPNISDRRHFQRAMATGEPGISEEVIVARTTGQPAIAAAAPVKNEEGRPIGLISLLLDLRALPRNLEGVRLRPDQMIFVADRTGRLALHSLKPDLTWEERDASEYEPVRETLDRGEYVGTVNGGLADGPRLVASVRTPKHGWVAGVSSPVSLALAPVQRGAIESMAVYLGTILVATLLALGLTYAITRPLSALTGAIAAFGRGEMGRRVEVGTGDELELTAQAFNRMASALQREQNRLRFLAEVGTALVSALDANRVMRLLAERSTEVLGEACWVYLLSDPEGGQCRLVGAHSRAPAMLERLGALIEEHHEWLAANLALPVAQTGEPILVRDVASANLEPKLRRQLTELQASSLLVVPLQARGHSVGLLVSLGLSEGRRFDEEDLALAMELAGRAGIVVDNALLFQQVREERRRLEAILEIVPVGVAVAEFASLQITMLNRMAETILGRPFASAVEIGRWQREFGLHRLTGEPYPSEETPLARALLHREVVAGEELVIRQPSGREVYVLVHATPLVDAEERLTGGVAAFQDVTPLKEAQRRMEELAREAERRRDELDAVIEAVGEGITIADGEGRIVQINRVGRQIWGFRPLWEEHRRIAEYAGQFDLRRPDGQSLPPDQWPLARAARGEILNGVEVVYRRADGRTFHLLFSSGLVRDERGQARLAMVIYRDISRIRELEQLREEFISVIAHDLRSPLTIITGFAGILQRIPTERHGRPEERRAVESILTSAKRLEKMVADLLDASRIEARRLTLAKEAVDLPRLVREVVDRMAETIRGHPSRVELKGQVPLLQADPERLEQVLGNLLSNAAKYSDPETEILVEVEPRENEVVVSVTNRGQGILPEEREAIFSRFHRARAAGGKIPGLGLGLYITKGLVEAHGGRIWVESEAGQYATFRFSLPLARGEEASGREGEPS